MKSTLFFFAIFVASCFLSCFLMENSFENPHWANLAGFIVFVFTGFVSAVMTPVALGKWLDDLYD